MFARGFVRLFGMALAVFCLCIALLPSEKVEAVASCSIRPISDDYWNGGAHTDGVNVVWLSARYDTGGHLFFHHVASDTTTEVYRTDDGTIGGAYLDGEHIVWTIGDEKSWASEEIYFHNLQTHTTINISNSPDQYDGEPIIQGNYIVWEGEVNGVTDIYLYDVTTGQKRNLSQSATVDDHYPKIDGRYIVWYGIDREDSYSQIFVYDLISDSKIALTDEPLFYDYYPEVYGTTVVWERGDGQDFEVFMHDLTTHQTTNLSRNVNASDDLPQIHGSRIIWMSTSNSTREFYSFDILTNQKQKLPAIDGSTVFPPQMFGSYTVWEADGKVYLDDGETVQHLDDQDGYDDWGPSIHSNLIVWQSRGTIFMATCDEGEPPTITDQPDDVTIPYQGTATFSVAATGEGDLSYQWYKGSSYTNSEPIFGATSITLTTGPFRVSTGHYWVRVSNQHGYTDSHMATAYINHVTSPTSFCQAQQLGIWLTFMPQSDGQYAAWPADTGQVYVHNALTDATTLFPDPSASSVEAVDAGRMLYNAGSVVDLNTGLAIIDLSIYPYEWTKLSGQYVFGQAANSLGVYNLNTGILTEVPIADAPDHFIHTVNDRYVIGSTGFVYDNPHYYVYDYILHSLTMFMAAPENRSYHDTAIYLDDTYAVWADYETTDILLLNIITGETTNISNTPGIYDSDVDIDSGKVVWWSSDSEDTDFHAYLYDIQSGVKTELSAGVEREHYMPRIEGNRVVWSSMPEVNYLDIDPQIHILDLETQSQKTILVSSNPHYLQMNDRWAIWQGTGGIYLYDGISTHQIVATTTLRIEYLKLVDNMLLWRGAPVDQHMFEYEYFWHPFVAYCQGAAPTITDQPDNLTLSANETATLTVTATGDGSLGYQWYAGASGDTSNLISGATSSSYTTPTLSANAFYWVRVNGTFGSVDSTTAVIAVRQTLPPTEVTPSPTTETPEPTTETPEPTPVPTVNLLTNAGFEADADGDKLPDDWKGKKTTVTKADKLKCDKVDKTFAHSAPCAFMFKGNPDGSTSKLVQKMTDTSAFVHGATVTLSAWVDPRSAPVGTTFAQAKIVYTDGSKSTLRLSIPAAEGYTQQTDSVLLDLTGKTVKAVKVDLRYDRPKGKFFVDDVMLKVEAGAIVLPLP